MLLGIHPSSLQLYLPKNPLNGMDKFPLLKDHQDLKNAYANIHSMSPIWMYCKDMHLDLNLDKCPI